MDNFLDQSELSLWRESVDAAVLARNGIKFPGTMVKTGEEDGVNTEADYYANTQ